MPNYQNQKLRGSKCNYVNFSNIHFQIDLVNTLRHAINNWSTPLSGLFVTSWLKVQAMRARVVFWTRLLLSYACSACEYGGPYGVRSALTLYQWTYLGENPVVCSKYNSLSNFGSGQYGKSAPFFTKLLR